MCLFSFLSVYTNNFEPSRICILIKIRCACVCVSVRDGQGNLSQVEVLFPDRRTQVRMALDFGFFFLLLDFFLLFIERKNSLSSPDFQVRW